MKKMQPKLKRGLIALLVGSAVAAGFTTPQYAQVLIELLNQLPF